MKTGRIGAVLTQRMRARGKLTRGRWGRGEGGEEERAGRADRYVISAKPSDPIYAGYRPRKGQRGCLCSPIIKLYHAIVKIAAGASPAAANLVHTRARARTTV